MNYQQKYYFTKNNYKKILQGGVLFESGAAATIIGLDIEEYVGQNVRENEKKELEFYDDIQKRYILQIQYKHENYIITLREFNNISLDDMQSTTLCIKNIMKVSTFINKPKFIPLDSGIISEFDETFLNEDKYFSCKYFTYDYDGSNGDDDFYPNGSIDINLDEFTDIDKNGRTPLHLSCLNGQLAICLSGRTFGNCRKINKKCG